MYDGYLVKIGEYIFPMKYIAEETYNITPHQRLDLDSKRDNLGELYREVADNRPSAIEFQTIAGLTNKEVKELFACIRAEFTNEDERKANVIYYDPETDEYTEAEKMYIPNPSFPIDEVDNVKKVVTYNAIGIQVVGY